MKVLYCGDVVGRTGRNVLKEHLRTVRRKLAADFVIVNGENAAHGFGITPKICSALFDAGADAITTGNHVWDQREILDFIRTEPRLIRPINFPKDTPGRGAVVLETSDGSRILIIQAMGQLFMDALDNPFIAVEEALREHQLGATVDCIVVDIHAEATSEKMAMGHFLDGRVSAVIGSHTHVPTADAQVLPGGTGYLTDLGMCGDYDSVIGMIKKPAIARMKTKLPTERLSPAEGVATLCAVFFETDNETGLVRHIAPLRLGGRLSEYWPGLDEKGLSEVGAGQ